MRAKKPRPPVKILPILLSCVKKLGPEQQQTIALVWALEYRIAEATGRAVPKDIHVLLNAMEARERALREELEALPEVTGAR